MSALADKRLGARDDRLGLFATVAIVVGGIVGTGIFTAPWLGGTGGEDFSVASQFMTQLTAVAITIAWCGIVSAILYKVVDAIVGLRVSVEAEREGLDLSSHGEAAYHA